ncbi:hypothetical protein BXZ70DRAFT_1062196 [Cristinia sonorae]|uniref:Uncharacterized protein n=1 Tax=Cristinia sonorae TaxID=1940300 RepID=A0A8K0XSV4_9AGAR|nr:hypothetical protein BXZ70DRAFT_1062196 [Cristinia sonorae]
MHSLHHIYAGDAVYAPPVLRAPSPSSSIGTDYGQDETSNLDRALTDEEFRAKVEKDLQLNQLCKAELDASNDPLLPRAMHPSAEKALHTQVLMNLRAEVRKLQEDEIFERRLHQNLQAAEEQQPSSGDIDAIMRSMMGNIAESSRAPTEPAGSPLPIVSPVPSNASLVGAFAIGSNSDDTSTTSASKRPSKTRTKGKSKRT